MFCDKILFFHMVGVVIRDREKIEIYSRTCMMNSFNSKLILAVGGVRGFNLLAKIRFLG